MSSHINLGSAGGGFGAQDHPDPSQEARSLRCVITQQGVEVLGPLGQWQPQLYGGQQRLSAGNSDPPQAEDLSATCLIQTQK